MTQQKTQYHLWSALLLYLCLQCPADINFWGKYSILKINSPEFGYKSFMEIKDEKYISFSLVSFV
jgi:hypothetical protein